MVSHQYGIGRISSLHAIHLCILFLHAKATDTRSMRLLCSKCKEHVFVRLSYEFPSHSQAEDRRWGLHLDQSFLKVGIAQVLCSTHRWGSFWLSHLEVYFHRRKRSCRLSVNRTMQRLIFEDNPYKPCSFLCIWYLSGIQRGFYCSKCCIGFF